MLSLTITNSVSELAALEPFVEQLCEAYNLDMPLAFSLQLVLDEAVSNVVNYAYGDATGMPVTIHADMTDTDRGRQLMLQIVDEGTPFNPIEEAPEVDTTLSAEERQIGGLGIFLIRQTMDHLSYERKDGQNIFTLTKNIGS